MVLDCFFLCLYYNICVNNNFLNNKMVRQVLALVLCVEALFFVALAFQGKLQFATVLIGALTSGTNTERQLNNLSVLKENILLDQSAQLKAEDMALKGYFAHNSPDGKAPWYWVEKVGYKYEYAGENLAVNFSESEDVITAWMNSPTHRANIVKGKYTEVGTGIATGTYKGKESTFVVQHYANPRVVVAKTVTKPVAVATSTNKNLDQKVLGASTEYSSSTAGKLTDLPISKTLEYILIAILILLVLFAIFFRPILRLFAYHSVLSNLILIAVAIALAWVLFGSYFSKGMDVITTSIDFTPNHSQDILE